MKAEVLNKVVDQYLADGYRDIRFVKGEHQGIYGIHVFGIFVDPSMGYRSKSEFRFDCIDEDGDSIEIPF